VRAGLCRTHAKKVTHDVRETHHLGGVGQRGMLSNIHNLAISWAISWRVAPTCPLSHSLFACPSNTSIGLTLLLVWCSAEPAVCQMLRGGAQGAAMTGLIPLLLHVEPPAVLRLLQLLPLRPHAAAQPVSVENDTFGSRERKHVCHTHLHACKSRWTISTHA
jgi:hypothetical protein